MTKNNNKNKQTPQNRLKQCLKMIEKWYQDSHYGTIPDNIADNATVEEALNIYWKEYQQVERLEHKRQTCVDLEQDKQNHFSDEQIMGDAPWPDPR